MAKRRVIAKDTAKSKPVTKKADKPAKVKPAAKVSQPKKAESTLVASKKAVKAKPKKAKVSKKAPASKKSVTKQVKSQKVSKPSSKQKDSDDKGASILPIIVSIVVLLGFLGLIMYMNDSPISPGADTGEYNPKELQQFPQLMEQINGLDEEYFTDWHKERLGQDMINPQFIDTYLVELDKLELAVNLSNGNETEINQAFIQGRRRMLVSQQIFQEALAYGTEGVVTQQFSCSEDRVQKVIEASLLYNESFHIGQKTIPLFDKVLRMSTESRDIVGVNLAKPRWYVTKFGDIKHLVDTNLGLINNICFKAGNISTDKFAATGIDVEYANSP